MTLARLVLAWLPVTVLFVLAWPLDPRFASERPPRRPTRRGADVMLRAIEAGYVQREIQESAYDYQRSVESSERLVVGVNKFASDEPAPVDVFTIDDSVVESQRRALAELRNTRDSSAVRRALESLQQAATGQDNLVPRILEAVEALATVQEISDCLRGVFGEYQQSDPF